MNKFSEIAKDDIHLAGDKLNLQDIIGKQIIVTGYKITKSKFKEDNYTAINFKRKIQIIQTHSLEPLFIVSSIMSSIGWLMHCDSYNILNKYIYSNKNVLLKMETASEQLGVKNPLVNYIR